MQLWDLLPMISYRCCAIVISNGRWSECRLGVRSYRDRLCSQGLLAGTDEALFLRWFDWMGLQRHIKVLGTFSRLYLRDGKVRLS